jgi:hypothetical protein
MSLTNTPPVPQYSLGLLCAKDFDSRDTLWDLLGTKLETIRHVYTNGVNALVTDFCREHGLPFTVYPVSGGKGLPWSTREVVDASEVVLIIATPASKSAAQVAEVCVARAKVDPAFKWRTIEHEPIAPWKAKVCQVAEIMEGMSPEDLAASPWAESVARVVGGKA